MQTGTIISGAGHVGLIGWALFGGVFAADPPEVQITPVAVISAQEYAALTSSPQTVAAPEAMREPEVAVDQPEAPTPETTPDRASAPDARTPDADDVPRAIPQPPARPEPVEDQVAVLQPPQEAPSRNAPRDRPAQRQIDRVAPTPVAPPPPDAAPAPERQEAVTPEAGETAIPQEPRDATAPEEAGTRIVTEAEAGGAPENSRRPSARPAARPPVRTAAAPEPRDATADAIAEALAQAQSTAARPQPAPSGPLLSSGQKNALVGKIGRVWRVDPGSRAARVTVVVSIDLTEDGRLASSPRLISANSDDNAAVQVAFRSARTAIIAASRSGGFDLPRESYASWRTIEMTFNPESMRIK